MQIKFWLGLVYLSLVAGCQNTTGQEITGGDIRLVVNKDIVFTDTDVDTTIKAYVMATVTFKDSLSLEPVNASIQMVKMKGLGQSNVDFLFADSRETILNDYESLLLEKYLPMLDSIFLKSGYEFIGEKKWIYGRKMAIAFPFEIKPE